MEIIEIPMKYGLPRKAYADVEPEFLDFKPNLRVLPANDFENPDGSSIYFVKKHNPGEPMWPDGGYSCVDSSNGFRGFFLDALIIHPSQIKTLSNWGKNGKRGRPSKVKINIEDGSEIVEGPKKQRGRPRKYEPGESPSAVAKAEIDAKPKGKRGRPRLNPELLVEKPAYVSTGGKRGRPSKYAPGQSPSALAKLAKQSEVKDPNRPGRGRPKKVTPN